MKLSISLIISCVFIAFLGHSVYNLISLYRAPYCDEDETCYKSYLNKNPKLELLVYISDSQNTRNYEPILHIPDFQYREQFNELITINIPKGVYKNGSIYIHNLIIPQRGNSEKPLEFLNAQGLIDSTYVRNKLTRHKIPDPDNYNLIHSEPALNATNKIFKPVPHLVSKYELVMCAEELNMPHARIPLELLKFMRVNKRAEFLPIVTQDIMQTRLRDLQLIEDKATMQFMYQYSPISIGKFKFIIQMESTFLSVMQMGFTLKDVDEVKGVFADTNIYLLCATLIVGGLHLLLDFLSFKNDVSFWKSHKSMAGLSSRTVIWRAFSQSVIFLYLLDEGTSLLVLIPSGIGMIIEFWKVTKAFKISFSLRGGFKTNANHQQTEAETKTKQYDAESMKYLSYLLYPLIVCSAIYSLLYQPHRSWYSWTISSMVNGVYAFGFLFMLPQLFVNYRLKSVAALPWRAFTYRAFNTFIDDIFAFIITMPTAHRIACFRDDVVFLIYLYQRWLYPVDKSRTDDLDVPDENQETKKEK